MTPAIQKLDKSTYNKAQFLYFSGREISEICLILSIEPDSLRFYVYGEDGNGTDPTTWCAIKKKLKPAAISLYLKDKATVLETTSGVALQIVSDSLNDLKDKVKNGEAVLTIDEISKLSKVVVDIDKMYRLEKGLSTETVEFLGLSRAEAKEILANDPFLSDDDLPWLEGEVVSE